MLISGYVGPSRPSTVEKWDGSSWTEVGDVNTARSDFLGAAGTVTAGLIYGGSTPASTVNTEEWNGSSWTETGNLNTATTGSHGWGTTTAALCVAGARNPPGSGTQANCEQWNGSSWTEVADVSENKYLLGGTCAGTTSAGACFGGYTPHIATTEHWNSPAKTTKTLTD